MPFSLEGEELLVMKLDLWISIKIDNINKGEEVLFLQYWEFYMSLVGWSWHQLYSN